MVLKLMSWVFKLLALLLVLVFIVLMPLSLLLRNVGTILFDRETMYAVAEENLFDREMVASVGQGLVSAQLRADAEFDNPFIAYVYAGMGSLEREEWLQLADLAVPPELAAESMESTLDQFYDWLDSSDPELALELDVVPIKEHALENALPIVELVLDAQPDCSAAELGTWEQLNTTAGLTGIPQCKPPEPYYSGFLELASTQFPRFVAGMPDAFDVTRQINAGNDLTSVKDTLLRSRELSENIWVLFVLLLLVTIPLGARSFNGALRWAGWPLALTGLLTFGFAVALFIATEETLTNLSASPQFANLPPAVLGSVRASGLGIFERIARPTLLQGLLMLILGGIFLVLAAWIKRDKDEELSDEELDTRIGALDVSVDDLTPAGITHPSQAPPTAALERRRQQEEAEKEEKKKKKDKDKPSGMFG